MLKTAFRAVQANMPARTMKAVVIHTPGGPEVLKLETIPIPAVTAGRILIQVKAFGLNR